MTREEFILIYTRFHFDIYKDEEWNKLKATDWWIDSPINLCKFRASELFSYLVSMGELIDISENTSEKSCQTCKTKDVCEFQFIKINGNDRQFCEGYENDGK